MFLHSSEKTALILKDSKISYNELLRHINYYASLFQGENPGKVAIFFENRAEWAYAFYSVWKKEAIPVPIDYLASAEEVVYILNDCKPSILFCSKGTQPVVQKAKNMLDYDLKIIVVDDLKYDLNAYPTENLEIKDVYKTAAIIYTSGTTGSSKGVMLSYDNMIANIESVSKTIPIFAEERVVLILLPLHHVFPLVGSLLAPLFVKSSVAISPSMVSEDIINTLQKNGVAIIIGVPRLYAAIHKGVMDKINSNKVATLLFKLARSINSRSFSKKIFKKVHEKFGGKVEYMVCGGAKLNEEVASDYKTLGFEMLEGFGMTEAAPMISFTRPNKWKIGAAGQPMPGVEVRIKEGEIIARGRNIMQGYYNRPEETAEMIKDGWLHTGDIGYLAEDDFVHITGRSKETIVLSNGKNINPEEVETALIATSPYISEVGVFLKDDSLCAAFLPDFKKLKEKEAVNLEDFFRWEIVDKYNKSVSPYKRITNFVFLKEELPKTRLGKIQRFKLVEFAEGKSKGKKEEREEPIFEEYIIIRDYLQEQKKGNVHPDDHLEIDLGLDSLDRLSLITFLESTFGIDVKEDVLISNATIEKLSNYMKEKKNKITVEAVKWAEILKARIDLKLPQSWFTQNLLKNTSRYFLKIYFRLKGEGTENIPDGPFILAPNHQSFLDGLFVSVFLKNRVMKNTYFYAKEKHVRNRFIRAFAVRNNVIVMDINKDLKESLQKLAEVLKSGKNIIIFPEGTRTNSGKLGSFKKAFAILSSELNVPVVPVSIKGAFEALPKGSKIPRPWKRIHVKFHKPIYPEGLDYDSLLEKVFNQLSTEVS